MDIKRGSKNIEIPFVKVVSFDAYLRFETTIQFDSLP
jgi:hypothetical protein